MEAEIERVPVLKLTEADRSSLEDIVAREFPLTIILNDRELVTLLCTPKDLKYLAVGFLASEGLLSSKADIKKLLIDETRGVARVETIEDKTKADEIFKRFISSGCGRGASFYSAADVQNQARIESSLKVSIRDILALVTEFQHHSEIYRATGGVHSAALCDTKSLLIFSEDIGRHNAIDKIFGRCLLEDIPTNDRIVITSGRISSEILLKVARRNMPIIVSKSAPTNLGVKLANDLGITLLGFVRGKRMNVYANDWRISQDGHG
jgi:FdhD protein